MNEILSKLSKGKLKSLLFEWSKLLTKAIMAYARSNCNKWFNRAFSLKWTPLYIKYNRRTSVLSVYGYAPNANVDKSKARAAIRSKPSGKRKPFFIRASSMNGNKRRYEDKGIWITPKKIQNRIDNHSVFFSKTSHQSIVVDTVNNKYTKTGDVRKYPFPAAWETDGSKNSIFLRGGESVSDKIVNSPEFQSILMDTFDQAVSKYI